VSKVDSRIDPFQAVEDWKEVSLRQVAELVEVFVSVGDLFQYEIIVLHHRQQSVKK